MTYFLFSGTGVYTVTVPVDGLTFFGGQGCEGRAAPRDAINKREYCSTVWWGLFAPVVVVGMGVSRVKTNERYGNKSLFAHLVLCIFFLTQLMVKQVIRGNAG
ncbi:hypothetical protein BGW80DRAFT_1336562 [Lactifluus volemus]|nr:hypothetical protein BGW80DRAFT_1336562 [Lactifluus volemus]